MSQSAGSGLSSIASVTGLKFFTAELCGVGFTIACDQPGAVIPASSVAARSQLFKEHLDMDILPILVSCRRIIDLAVERWPQC
jgi:hypothetical protein